MDRPGLGVPMGSLNLPSSMDIARYLEQVQEVEPASPSPRGYATAEPQLSTVASMGDAATCVLWVVRLGSVLRGLAGSPPVEEALVTHVLVPSCRCWACWQHSPGLAHSYSHAACQRLAADLEHARSGQSKPSTDSSIAGMLPVTIWMCNRCLVSQDPEAAEPEDVSLLRNPCHPGKRS